MTTEQELIDYSNRVKVEAKLFDYIEHHGVKGQKWGTRKDAGHVGEKVKTKKLVKLDKKFEQNSQSFKTTVAIHNRAAKLTNDNDVDRINNKPQYKDKDFSRESPLRQKYYKEHQTAFLNNLSKAATEQGTNASGTKKYKILEKPDGSWDIFTADVSHSNEIPVMHVIVMYNVQGRITKLEVDDVIAQTETFISNFLEHHGVKGQKWGVSRRGRSSFNPEIAPGTRHPFTKHLSDSELKVLVERMRLDQQFMSLAHPKKTSLASRGSKFASDILKDVGKQHARKLIVEGVSAAGTIATAALIAKKMSG